MGSEPALRPVLEALFHRMLLLPGPVRRLEPLRAIRELLRSPGRLADLLLLKSGTQRHAGDDMAIIRLYVFITAFLQDLVIIFVQIGLWTLSKNPLNATTLELCWQAWNALWQC